MPELQHALGRLGVTDNILNYSSDSIWSFSATGFASAAYPAANRALFFPFRLYLPFTATRMFSFTGATVAGTNHIDFGIYTLNGNLIVSTGSTLLVGANTVQAVAFAAATPLNPGTYYMAIATDGTDTFFRKSVNAQIERIIGKYQQAAAFPLPATATFATPASAYVPIVGISDQGVV